MKRPGKAAVETAIATLTRAAKGGSTGAARALLVHDRRGRKRKPRPKTDRRVGVVQSKGPTKRDEVEERARVGWIGGPWDPIFSQLAWGRAVLDELGPERVEAIRAQRRVEGMSEPRRCCGHRTEAGGGARAAGAEVSTRRQTTPDRTLTSRPARTY